jgi:hypothetical protein
MAASLTLQAWAAGFLAHLGAPATGGQDPRMKFLEAWATKEGTFDIGNESNPLSIENNEGEASTNWNKQGVKVFKNVASGYVALEKYLVNQGITGMLTQLKSPTATLQSLTQALADAHWAGSATPAAVADSLQYAQGIGVKAGLPSNEAAMVGEGAPGALNDQAQAGQGAGNAAQLSTSSSSGLTPAEAREIDTPYTGPGAYKGFDLQGVLPGQMQLTKQAINTILAEPGGVKGMLDAIYKNFGSESWMANIPEVRTLLIAGSQLGYDSNKALFDSAFQNTNWYKTTTTSARNYAELQANDPASAHSALLSAEARITNQANELGVTLTAAQVQSLGQTVVKQSISSVVGDNPYSESLVDDATIDGYISAAAQTPAFAAGLTGSQAASSAGITGATTAPTTTDTTNAGPGGDAAYLYNQFTTIAKNYMLNWTPQQIAAAVQKALLGDTGQDDFLQGQVAGFQTTAQNTAKALYPAFAGAVGTDTSAANDQDMYQATQSYRNIIAQFTGNADADSIDLNNPQWSWILSGGAPPAGSSATLASATGGSATSSTASSATASPPTIDQLQTYLMGTPQFQSTNMAKEMGWQVGSAITKAFGF